MAFGAEQRGESQILFEVARQDLIAERLDTTVDAIRTRLRAGKIGYADLAGGDGTVQVRIRDAADIEKARTALADLLAPVASGVFGTSSVHELTFDEPEPGLFDVAAQTEGDTPSPLSQCTEYPTTGAHWRLTSQG